MKEVKAGVSQSSVGDPLFFNLFINDLFLFLCCSTLSNYTDGNNLFTTGTDIQTNEPNALSDLRTVNN